MEPSEMPDASGFLILVAGTPGAGKTNWIRSHIESSQPSYFMHIGAEDFPLDAMLLAQGHDHLQVLTEMPNWELLNSTALDSAVVYVECGYPIEVQSLLFPEDVAVRRIAVLSPDAPTQDWETWADEMVVGLKAPIAPPQLWRLKLSGQILETASLEIFWQELSLGAYGVVDRAKAIFEVSEGIPLLAECIRGREPIEMTELNLERNLSGRPDRFSGIEVLGSDLDTGAIVETLKLCFLKDDQVVAYQAQVRSALQEEEENHP
jgi:hypothetical protein